MTDETQPGEARSYREIPQPGLLRTLRNVVSQGGGRMDMLTPLRELRADYGDVVLQAAGRFRMLNLFGPDANRFVLQDRDRIFSAREPWTMIMGRIFPNGLLLRDGQEHKHHRKIMHSAFKRPALRSYLDRMNPMVEAGIARWPERGAMKAFPAFKALTLDMAATIFVGVDLGEGTEKMNRVFEDLVAASMSRVRLPIPGLEFQRGLQGRAFMIEYFRDLLPKKRSGDGPDMFTRLCHGETEGGHRFADQEVIDHMIFLMMAAHDTTTSTLTSMAFELARHPAWQERCRDESRALGKDHLDFEDLERLPSLGLVMNETLRRYPPLPVIPRTATDDFVFSGYRVPARTMVVVAPIVTHHMEEWWDDPFRFDPERFAPERAEDTRHTHSWIPFGSGVHHCIGFRFAESQVKTVMHQLLRRTRWSVPAGYAMPVQQAPISKPTDGLPLRLEPA